jgi:protein-S-isoprenylcysteine O-methyltransferase Ste14
MREKKGEHPFGDAGQLISLGVFLIVWAGDSFFLHKSTFLSNYVPLYVRLAILGIALIVALYLYRSGHVVVTPEQRPSHVVTTGTFRLVRHPLYLASLSTYLGMTVATASLLALAILVGIIVSTIPSRAAMKSFWRQGLEKPIRATRRERESECRE